MPLERLVVVPLRGLMRVLQGERDGLVQIGADSPAGWVASFVVPAILLAPFYAWMALRRFADLDFDPEPGRAVLVEAVGYAIGWTAFPVISHAICARLGKREAWFGYVAAYNWANVPQLFFYLPAALLGTVEGVPPLPLFLFGVIAVSAAIALHFRVARVVLGLDPVPALMLVAADLAVGQIVARLVDKVHGL
jgi:hypothetical protein